MGKKQGNQNIAIVAIAIALLSMLFAAVLFYLYSTTFDGGISSKRDDWATFGSLLSGAFTLVAAISSLATLIYLWGQGREQQQVIAKQMQALSFRQYVKHREAFFDLLELFESYYKNQFKILNYSKQYYVVFPNNSPHSISYIGDEAKESETNFVRVLEELYSLNRRSQRGGFSELGLAEFTNIQAFMGIEPLGKLKHGDVFFNGEQCYLNVFDINRCLSDLNFMANEICHFSAISMLPYGRGEFSFKWKHEALQHVLVSSRETGEGWAVHGDQRLYSLLTKLVALVLSRKYIDAPGLYDFLQKAYSSSERFSKSFLLDTSDFLSKADRFCIENMEANPESFQQVQHELTVLFSNGLKGEG
ncbi:hypothetical protein [Paenalcaligenes faecalis]|uniref:hypothetical protein n=1 Tax=Paenalcaligenes faecalis TaxID=2980099 RepID=UPI0022B99C8A|nr:hypothetical protein [Paenalcaligenes faecalis]